MSQTDLAERLRVSRSAVSYLLSSDAKQSSLIPKVDALLGMGERRELPAIRPSPFEERRLDHLDELIEFFSELNEFNRARVIERARVLLEQQQASGFPLRRQRLLDGMELRSLLANTPTGQGPTIPEKLQTISFITAKLTDLIFYADTISRERRDLDDAQYRGVEAARQRAIDALSARRSEIERASTHAEVDAAVAKAAEDVRGLNSSFATAGFPVPPDWVGPPRG